MPGVEVPSHEVVSSLKGLRISFSIRVTAQTIQNDTKNKPKSTLKKSINFNIMFV